MSLPIKHTRAGWLQSLRTKIALAMGVVALTTATAFILPAFHVRKKAVLSDFQIFVRSVAGTTALAINGSSLGAIRTNEDVAGSAFQNARSVLDRSRAVNNLRNEEIYILRPLSASSETEFIVMLQQKTFVGDHYRVLDENKAALAEAWATGRATNTGLYEDPHGRWISGYAPILGGDGKPVAIIEVDAEVSRYYAELDRSLWMSLGIGGIALLVGMLPGLWLAGGITRGLQRLTMGIQRFRAGDTAVQVTAESNDEVGILSTAFNDLFEGLQEKLALLPYVSRLNAEAVQRSRTDPAWLMGREQDVMVLFADIRGFTSFAEDRDAQALVRELNQLLSVQADVVISAGGDVDKFIGDAIMAVFLDSTDNAEQVFACAQKLIERTRSEITVQGWPLALGIGIHRGLAVVGSIGSATRRDFTAIGHTTNLSARLCSQAGPWEILCTEAFHASLSARSQAEFRLTEPMQFKNVQHPVTTYSCAIRVGENAAA